MRILYYVLVAMASAVHAAHLVAIGNLHTMIDGELYRSARPSAEEIARRHQRYGIRTSLNLKGARNAAWLAAAAAAARKLDVKLIDYRLAAHVTLTRGQIKIC